MVTIPQRVVITEVVCRDGFQDEARMIATSEKLALIHRLIQAGVRSIEATAFVHPKVVPQMADADTLLAQAPREHGVRYSALLPNLKGAERALAAGLDEIHLVVSASDSHNRANLNRTTAQSLAQLATVAAFVQRAAPHVTIVGTVATAFGCPFTGRVPLERLGWVIGHMQAMGIEQVVLADTTGMANPLQVKQTLYALRERFPQLEWGLHLHNTRGLGLANAYAGLETGVTRFDAALGGLGGCPFAPGATGNIATEDLVHMLHEMGVETGIDLDALIAAARGLPALIGHDIDSFVVRSGKACDLHTFSETAIARV
ncbi:hydroxymethylglutaryl-CoA lyase [Chloroflexus sp.]|uniref:hydroxymethylglutaryl-CoA lyase n=1 Tax=Chloroflexus sp. TaxID=1904827 RepID=UPI00298EF6E7|nr:hydroxymethylglutaryl-CoA lyase [Chloroflexus sp.]MDW8403834.1 hydroxymethylglutaryl-CoA lyase [Chloroflexus sp.]